MQVQHDKLNIYAALGSQLGHPIEYLDVLCLRGLLLGPVTTALIQYYSTFGVRGGSAGIFGVSVIGVGFRGTPIRAGQQ
jgi:hypothetical protein